MIAVILACGYRPPCQAFVHPWQGRSDLLLVVPKRYFCRGPISSLWDWSLVDVGTADRSDVGRRRRGSVGYGCGVRERWFRNQGDSKVGVQVLLV